jgi:ABC-type Fe3+/spermidine/putrescine transport system ATPase subunit
MSIIELNNITHVYGNKPVLQDINLHIEANRLTCLLGGSGCGKTTILRLIAGLETPQNGQIRIGNKTVTENQQIIVPPHQRNIGFIFQDLALWPHFTVYKNIAFGLTAQKKKNVKKKVLEMLDFFGMQTYTEKYPHQLSGGQKQLVAISRALVLKPQILLMDEPLANLDVKLKRKILEHIKNLKQSSTYGINLTFVFVTHDHKETFAIADNIVVINDGEIEEAGNVEQLKNSQKKFVKYFIEY